jgi:hypothetical protein
MSSAPPYIITKQSRLQWCFAEQRTEDCNVHHHPSESNGLQDGGKMCRIFFFVVRSVADAEEKEINSTGARA